MSLNVYVLWKLLDKSIKLFSHIYIISYFHFILILIRSEYMTIGKYDYVKIDIILTIRMYIVFKVWSCILKNKLNSY